MASNCSTRIPLLLLCALGAGGCSNAVEDGCRGCLVVSERAPLLPPLSASTRAVVVLVHGAFGFGAEWGPVVEAVRARPRTSLVAFAWGGPWTRKPSLPAEALLRIVQHAVDEAPPGARV